MPPASLPPSSHPSGSVPRGLLAFDASPTPTAGLRAALGTRAMEVCMRRWVAYSALTLAVGLSVLGGWTRPAVAQAQVEVPLTMTKDQFDPAELKVKAGARFILVITNKDDITHEIDIPKLRIEKKVRAGQVLKVQIPALKPGKYELVDDDSTPELHGMMIAE
jgi:heme/copper-type cytochrome/quinol oxidase subunit 2